MGEIVRDLFADQATSGPFSLLIVGSEPKSLWVTIVMSHHAPSLRSIPDEVINDPLTAAYASNLEPVIERFQPNLWVHGHLHNSSDYKIGFTRVVCNPRGYTPSELNPQFDPELVIEIL